ncbi:MAG: DMT family protein [Chitinophagaceae bacterium]
MVPANRIGPFQLKIIQEVLTPLAFRVFDILVLKEEFRWNYMISFAFIKGAAYFAFKKVKGNKNFVPLLPKSFPEILTW